MKRTFVVLIILMLGSSVLAQTHQPTFTLSEDWIIFDAWVVEISPPPTYFINGTGVSDPAAPAPITRSLTDAPQSDPTLRLSMKLDYGASYAIRMIGFADDASNPIDLIVETQNVSVSLTAKEARRRAWIELGAAWAKYTALSIDFDALLEALNNPEP